jgi:hypothetical protein
MAYGREIEAPALKPTRGKQSAAVWLVAFYQFVKAPYFAYAFWQVWAQHKAYESVGNTLYDPLLNDHFYFVLPGISAYCVIVGIGLFTRRRWARLLALVPFLFFGIAWLVNRMSGSGGRLLPLEPDAQAVYLIGELLSVCILLLLPSASEVFGDKQAG